MNNNLTEMVFILDMSGSMSDLASDTIGGYNSLIEEQKKQAGDANITTVLFDDRYIVLHDRVDIKKVNPLTSNEYCPRGLTAMLDAVGRTINSIGEKLAATPEAERPGNVVVTIITDGYENSSKEYTWKAVQDMIKEQREKYSWVFTFIGANIDTKTVSESLGIDARLAKSYTANKVGTDSVYKTMSKAVSYTRSASARKMSDNTALNDEELTEMSVVMDEIK